MGKTSVGIEQFEKTVETIRKSTEWREPIAFGICRVDRAKTNRSLILQAAFPFVNFKENYKSAAVFLASLKAVGVAIDTTQSEFVADITIGFINEALNHFAPFIGESAGEKHKNVQVLLRLAEIGEKRIGAGEYRIVFLFADEAPKSVEAVYLKLYALSLGLTPLRSLNLTGAFGVLPNVAWVGNEPIELDWLRENEIALKLRGEYPKIDFIDKFPRYLQHIIPADNVRILDGSKVRMGAHLAAGTTIMPGASYVNFNAGTTGACMVEGRISSSAIVGAGSDVGGGASILGVLSGTSGKPVTIGKNTLLGANSVTGIPLGDGCIVDAGIAILEGTKIALSNKEANEIAKVNAGFNVTGEKEQIVKGIDLAGLHGIHYRVNSQTGQTQAVRSKREIKLNSELH
ncbi:2,3,4,5-tetrahydropyridine-2,6-dicarboxylate N-succinyltransferase [Campylobacterota bacterium]|nr:2,3,4,5-tetrahydropyridine-2,6-dicarboxylate N-succinyltransferase [Campylobacterota bacterium]GHV06457.1 2,3,4,5-tetrahydropyridine-2,6-dicarboxylate N-succinyltransferase [Campylobacterota bacterium]